ncbi:MAG: ATP-binding protein [Bdellovibrionota bacterium]
MKNEAVFDFTKSRAQMVIIEAVRLGFLLAILAITLIFQALQPEFVNIEVILPVYIMMACAFAVNALYLIFFEDALKIWISTAILFSFEAIFITSLIHFTGVNQSIFLFLYLVNIILCGFVFQRRGALLLALWTSVLFSVLMILGPDLRGQTLFFAVGLNNLAFFAVAMLSGFLSEQINFMGSALMAQGKDLRALKNLNALIIDNIATGLLTVDSEGRIIQANRAACDILDRPVRQIVGESLEVVVPDLFEKVKSATKSRQEDGEAADRFDVTYKDPSDEKTILEITVSPLPTESAMPGFIVTFQDLTRIRRLEYQVRQSEKMAAVGQLAAGIAHEIRNPLASISGSIQMLGGSFTARQEEEQQLMRIVMREIDRLNNLITEFLDFVRPPTLKDDPVDLNQLIRDVLEMIKFNKTLRPEVKLVVKFEATSVISGNRDQLKQAFLNIIINGYQAMNDSALAELAISTGDAGGKVIVKIRDSGCGIDEKGLRKIFEPFHTTKPKGTGLGLAVTHKIIESHEGRIFVESTKGVGTEFTLEFPTREQRGLDENALADSKRASENFSIAFRGQKRGNG